MQVANVVHPLRRLCCLFKMVEVTSSAGLKALDDQMFRGTGQLGPLTPSDSGASCVSRDAESEAYDRSCLLASTSSHDARPVVPKKSLKRRLAEQLLAARYSAAGSSGNSLSLLPQVFHQQACSVHHCAHPEHQHLDTLAEGSEQAEILSGSQAQDSTAGAEHTAASVRALKAPGKRARLALGDRQLSPASISQHNQQHSLHTASVPQAVQVLGCVGQVCANVTPWCRFEVKIPHVDWQRVFDESPNTYSYYSLGRGYEKYYMSDGLQVYVVEDASQAADAVARLRASMQDPVIAIDLEWRPEHSKGEFNRAALVQISSATVCLLIRASAMGFQLPEAVRSLLADPTTVVVGFSWESADEMKMSRTFGGFGKGNFGRYFDLSDVARDMGYPHMSLLRLTNTILGLSMTKSKAVTRSRWDARALSLQQIKYAALDVFATGQVFRGLRLWHSSPSPCPGCHQPVGARMPPPKMQCAVTGRTFSNLEQYSMQCKAQNQPEKYIKCRSCGRTVPVLEMS